jgi:hypothetical protein
LNLLSNVPLIFRRWGHLVDGSQRGFERTIA